MCDTFGLIYCCVSPKVFRYADLGMSWEYKDRNASFGTFATKGVGAAVSAP
jgi:hypothetical protein